MGERWFVFTIKTGATALAEANLFKQGFPVFIPRHPRDGQPLFPGYGFVCFDMANPGWSCINNTRGVGHLLPLRREEPLWLPPGVVDQLRESLSQQEMECGQDTQEPLYLRDDVVSIVSGPLVGYTGRYQSRFNKGMAVVLLSFFGIEVRATVNLHQLKPKGSVAKAA